MEAQLRPPRWGTVMRLPLRQIQLTRHHQTVSPELRCQEARFGYDEAATHLVGDGVLVKFGLPEW